MASHFQLSAFLNQADAESDVFDFQAADPYAEAPVTRGTAVAAQLPSAYSAIEHQLHGSKVVQCTPTFDGLSQTHMHQLFSKSAQPVPRDDSCDAQLFGGKSVYLPAIAGASSQAARAFCVEVANHIAAHVESQFAHVQKINLDFDEEEEAPEVLQMEVVSFDQGARIVFVASVYLDVSVANVATPCVEFRRMSGDGFAFAAIFRALASVLESFNGRTIEGVAQTPPVDRSLPVLTTLPEEDLVATLAIACDFLASKDVATQVEGARVLLDLAEKPMDLVLQERVLIAVAQSSAVLSEALQSGFNTLVVPVALLVSSISSALQCSPMGTDMAQASNTKPLVACLLDVVDAAGVDTAISPDQLIGMRTCARALHSLTQAGAVDAPAFSAFEQVLRAKQGQDSWVQHHLELALCGSCTGVGPFYAGEAF